MGDLIGHWPLAGNAGNRAAADLQSSPADIEFGHAGPDGKPDTAAAFNGRSSCIEIADHPALDLGQDDFAITAWVNSDADRHDVAGSILSKYDPELRRGMHLYIATNDGVTSAALANARQLSFGIDDARADQTWADCGRPGNAVKIDTLSVVNEELYAGTLEIGADECGHLWRYAGGQDWVDLGNPVGCNAVRCLVEFNGDLYCATGRYALAGSCLGEILNTTPGGQVFRLTAEGEWIYCGHPGEAVGLPDDMDTGEYNFGKADDATSLQVWNGSLYVVSNHIKGVWRYDGGTEWTCVGPDSRVLSLTVYRGALYALGNGGPIYRFDGGNEWTDCGTPEGSTQNYGAATVRGELYVGTWPGAEVFRYAGDNNWQGFGRVGYEMEVMAMTMYNGKLYVGSLPMAHAWRMEETGDDRQFDVIANLDETPVKLRRLWSMAIHDGRLYAGTLPGGRVFAFEAGKMATWDRRFPGGWHHLAAVKRGGSLELYVDGVLQASSTPFLPGDFTLGNTCPLSIGFGADTYFSGMMSDVRLYRGALDHGVIGELCGNGEG